MDSHKSRIILPAKGEPEFFTNTSIRLFSEKSASWAEDLRRHSIIQADDWFQALRYAEESESILLVQACSSALDVLDKAICEADIPTGTAVCAGSQWSGRGRMRREWHSPYGNMYGAVLCPGFRTEFPGLVSLGIGLLMVRALEESGLSVQIKWPNDLLLEDRKIGGILIEERRGRLRVGIGLNLESAPDVGQMRPDAALQAGALKDLGFQEGPLSLWQWVVTYLRSQWSEDVFDKGGDILPEIEKRLAWLGRRVRVYEDFDKKGGIIVGLMPDGGLRLLGEGGETVVHSGSILPEGE